MDTRRCGRRALQGFTAVARGGGVGARHCSPGGRGHDDLRRQGPLELLGHWPGHVEPAPVHDQRGGGPHRPGRHGDRPVGHVQRDGRHLERVGYGWRPITFRVADGNTVVVSGETNGFRISSESYVVVQGFHVTNTTSHGINVKDSSNITVVNNTVDGAGTPTDGNTARGISITTTTNSVVRRNTTHHNSDAGIYVGVGATGNTIVVEHQPPQRP